MKHILILTFLFCAATFGNLQAQTASDEHDMQDFTRNFMTAYNQQDADALQKMYMEHAVRIDQKGNKVTGADKIAELFAEQFRLNNATVFDRHISTQNVGSNNVKTLF